MEFLNRTLYGNSVLDWLIVAAILAAAYLFLAVVRAIVVRRLGAIAERTSTPLDNLAVEVVRRTGVLAALGVWLLVAVALLKLPANIEHGAHVAALVALIVQAGVWATAMANVLVTRHRRRAVESQPGAVTTIDALGFLARLVIWSIALLVLLDNLGVNVSALITGLGIGGVAIALAVQNILGDLFASLAIVLDKPFEHGDFIIVGDYLGTVERVGLKTTRMRSLSGEQLVFSNSDLLGSRIRNYKRMFERRVVFSFGVVYQTSLEHLREIPPMVEAIIKAQERVRFDRAHFKQYGESSLDFEIVYYVLVPDYNVYMDIQQAINLTIFEQFAARGIEFAYPTRTLYVAGNDGAKEAVAASS